MTRLLMCRLATFALLLVAVAASAQSQEEYLDVFTVQVKPEKRAEFDAIAKRMRTRIEKTAATRG